MNRHSQVLERMQHTNPVPDLELIHESDLAALTSLLNERKSTMIDLKETPTTNQPSHALSGPRWRRPVWAFVAAALLVLVTVGAFAFLGGDESGNIPDVGDEPAAITPTSAATPTTSAPPPTTTPAPTTTLPEPAALGPPVIDTLVEDIAFDNSGDAWVTSSTETGSEIYRLQDGAWAPLELPAEFAEPGAIRAAPDGSVWVTGQGGLARYDGGDWTVYRPEDNDCGPTLAIDTNGGVWAICPDTFMRIEGDQLVRVEALGETSWGGWWVTAGPDGTVYNTGYLELLSFDGVDWSLQTCPGMDASGFGFGCAQLLGVGPDGDVWAGLGWEGLDGLIRFHGEALEPELIRSQANGAVDMAHTSDGHLWFAVPEYREYQLEPGQTLPPAGLFRFDGTSWHRYSVDDGLNSNSVASVEGARDGTLWIGTDRGIDVYDPVLDRFFPLGGES